VIAAVLVLVLGCSRPSAEEPAAATKYEPNWESLQTHTAPEWYRDAKFGIFIHWGLYSVPAYAPPSGKLHEVPWDQWFKNNAYAEWYMNSLKIDGSPTQQYHYKTYGKNFAYLDFVPPFNEAVTKWDPAKMAGLFSDVHARYVVLTTKHHDGFLLWSSETKNPNRPEDQQHAARDIAGELAAAVRDRNMKMGFYYSGGLDWSFNPTPIIARDDVAGTIIHDPKYAAYADSHWRELIKRYKPSILWNDIGYPEQGDVAHIFADYFNEVPDGVVNNRWEIRKEGAPRRHHDFETPEYKTMDDIYPEKWETCRGLGYSFGYNQVEGPEQTIKEDELIHLLIDVTSKNGNLLLNVGPKADGSIPAIQEERLRALGAWLGTNGEAIFGTRPWERAAGKTTDGIDVRFTRKNKTVYAILLAKPKASEVTILSVPVAEGATVTLLGTGDLAWTAKEGNLQVTLPANLPVAHAYAIKIAKP
jgi:alpha-L-fucosidase